MRTSPPLALPRIWVIARLPLPRLKQRSHSIRSFLSLRLFAQASYPLRRARRQAPNLLDSL
jgi:hypothetical protein